MPRSSRSGRPVSSRTSDSSGRRSRSERPVSSRTSDSSASTPPQASRDHVASTPPRTTMIPTFDFSDPFASSTGTSPQMWKNLEKACLNGLLVASTPPQDHVASTPPRTTMIPTFDFGDPFASSNTSPSPQMWKNLEKLCLDGLLQPSGINEEVNMTTAQIKEAITEIPQDGADNTFLRNQQCNICLESWRDILFHQDHLFSTKCGHIFCRTCANKYITINPVNPTCPSCRKKLEGPDYFFRIHLPMHPMFKTEESRQSGRVVTLGSEKKSNLVSDEQSSSEMERNETGLPGSRGMTLRSHKKRKLVSDEQPRYRSIKQEVMERNETDLPGSSRGVTLRSHKKRKLVSDEQPIYASIKQEVMERHETGDTPGCSTSPATRYMCPECERQFQNHRDLRYHTRDHRE